MLTILGFSLLFVVAFGIWYLLFKYEIINTEQMCKDIHEDVEDYFS